MSNKLSYQLILLISVLSFCTTSNAQLGIPTTPSPVWGSMDTMNLVTADSTIISIDPDPTNNPFMQSSGQIQSNDDPGGPGSGGGFGDPPPDAVIPIDGGVGILLLGGAIAAIGRYRKKEEE